MDPSRTITSVAEEFGIEYETLRYHMKKAQADQDTAPATNSETGDSNGVGLKTDSTKVSSSGEGPDSLGGK